jgi:hypothetical protein
MVTPWSFPWSFPWSLRGHHVVITLRSSQWSREKFRGIACHYRKDVTTWRLISSHKCHDRLVIFMSQQACHDRHTIIPCVNPMIGRILSSSSWYIVWSSHGDHIVFITWSSHNVISRGHIRGQFSKPKRGWAVLFGVLDDRNSSLLSKNMQIFSPVF